MILFECPYLANLSEHYKKAVQKAKDTNEIVYFEANCMVFIADKNSDENLVDLYLDECLKYNVKVLGPLKLMLSDEYKKEQNEINEQKRIEYRKEFEVEAQKRDEKIDFIKKLVKDEELQLNDIESYKNLKSDTGNNAFLIRIVTSYAEDLMKILQIKYKQNGEITKHDVKQAEQLIDYHGISGIQHAMVVNLLKRHWTLFNELIF